MRHPILRSLWPLAALPLVAPSAGAGMPTDDGEKDVEAGPRAIACVLDASFQCRSGIWENFDVPAVESPGVNSLDGVGVAWRPLTGSGSVCVSAGIVEVCWNTCTYGRNGKCGTFGH